MAESLVAENILPHFAPQYPELRSFVHGASHGRNAGLSYLLHFASQGLGDG